MRVLANETKVGYLKKDHEALGMTLMADLETA